MNPSELFASICDRITMVVKQPFRKEELSMEELETVLDSLTVFLGNLLAEKRAKEEANG